MSGTHDYETRKVKVTDLTNADVLVGESGGLSAVYDSKPFFGVQMVETEHGTLILFADQEMNVLVA